MLQPRIYRSTVSSAAAADASLNSLLSALNTLTFCSKHAPTQRLSAVASTSFVRHASHAAQGRANGPKDSAGRRLGAKKSASEYVIPGNIIFKQRGTKWFPGENCDMGKDHTIYALESGYVRYYRNPLLHPKRRYIGVALEREGPRSKLPTPPNAPTRRRLGMYAVPIKSAGDDRAFLESHLSMNSIHSETTTRPPSTLTDTPASGFPAPGVVDASLPPTPSYRPGTYRETNYSIGRPAPKPGIPVRKYQRNDRWLAWRKRVKRIKAGILAKAAKATRKGGKVKGRKSNKGTAVAGPGKRN